MLCSDDTATLSSYIILCINSSLYQLDVSVVPTGRSTNLLLLPKLKLQKPKQVDKT